MLRSEGEFWEREEWEAGMMTCMEFDTAWVRREQESKLGEEKSDNPRGGMTYSLWHYRCIESRRGHTKG